MEQVDTNTVMMICPNLRCKKVLRVPAQYRGQNVKCHYCSTTFKVPEPRQQKPQASNG